MSLINICGYVYKACETFYALAEITRLPSQDQVYILLYLFLILFSLTGPWGAYSRCAGSFASDLVSLKIAVFSPSSVSKFTS